MQHVKILLYHIEILIFYLISIVGKSSKGKVFYGQEPPSGESTTTECGVNCQLFAVIY